MRRGGGKLMKKSILLLAVVLMVCLASSAYAFWTDVLIESRPGGINFEWYSEEGTFADSSAKSSAAGITPGIGSRYASALYTDRYAAYIPDITDAGYYDVWVTWGTSTTGHPTILHEVIHMEGTFSVILNQNSSAGLQNTWVYLGNFPFDVGTAGMVKQSVQDPILGNRIMADAVKFTYTGPLVPEPGSFLALGTGLIGLIGVALRKRA